MYFYGFKNAVSIADMRYNLLVIEIIFQFVCCILQLRNDTLELFLFMNDTHDKIE